MADIEYFYSAHSAFAYIGSARLMQIACDGGHRLVHRPMDLRRVVAGAGALPTRERSQAHRDYFFGREIRRWSEQREAPVLDGRPRYHDNDIELCNCVLIAAEDLGHGIDALAHRLLEAHWRDDADLADAAMLRRAADEVGLPGDRILDAAVTPVVIARYHHNTEEAIARNLFGSPTYFVDGDMFYGQDRLEMVERALRVSYRP